MDHASIICVCISYILQFFKKEEVINLRRYGEKQQKFEEEKGEVRKTQI